MACQRPEDKIVIGVLDIYGFEIFQNNSFEQFCINHCNEKLQQVFIELTLKTEQEEYQREGIKWEKIPYFNNKIICDLIEQIKPPGIVSILDDECMLGKATDLTFLDKMNTHFAKHDHYESWATSKEKKESVKFPQTHFKLKHYAGDVYYDVAGFIDKNKDTLFGDLISVMQSSQIPLAKQLFPEEVNNRKRPPTAGTQFRTAVNELVTKLTASHPHYIRCIKPNEQKRGFVFDEPLVRHQVRYLGLLENVRVRRAGFAYRQTYDRFLRRYKMLTKATWPFWQKDEKAGTEEILKGLNIPADEFRLGKTKVFIRNPKTLFMLEEKREASLPGIVVKMQAVWRGFAARKKYNAVRARFRILQAYRKYKFRKWFFDLEKVFKDVKSDPALGKGRAWPKNPPVLNDARVLFGKIWATWRAHTMISRLSKAEQADMRQRILAMDIFKGKKPYNLRREYKADYMAIRTDPLQQKYLESFPVLLQKFGDQRILFADEVPKVDRSGKIEQRVMVVTEQNIYKLDPKSFKVKAFDGSVKTGIPLADVSAISMSPNPDTFVVIHTKENTRDVVINLGSHGQERYSEFVAVLHRAIHELSNEQKTLSIKFNDNITFNNTSKLGKTTTLSFKKDPTVSGSVFKKEKNGNVILWNDGPAEKK